MMGEHLLISKEEVADLVMNIEEAEIMVTMITETMEIMITGIFEMVITGIMEKLEIMEILKV